MNVRSFVDMKLLLLIEIKGSIASVFSHGGCVAGKNLVDEREFGLFCHVVFVARA
jgi:hypothetical protein